jgi:hypothetical protein
MSISTRTFPGNQQQQQHFRSSNPRFNENNGIRSRFPPPGSHVSTSGESFSNQLPNPPHWTNSDRNTYPVTTQLIHPNHNEQQQQQQILTSQLFQKHQLIPVFL